MTWCVSAICLNGAHYFWCIKHWLNPCKGITQHNFSFWLVIQFSNELHTVSEIKNVFLSVLILVTFGGPLAIQRPDICCQLNIFAMYKHSLKFSANSAESNSLYLGLTKGIKVAWFSIFSLTWVSLVHCNTSQYSIEQYNNSTV